MTTDFIEFQTNECVSDDKETIKQIDTKSSTVVVVVPDVSKIYSIVSRVKGISKNLSFYGH